MAKIQNLPKLRNQNPYLHFTLKNKGLGSELFLNTSYIFVGLTHKVLAQLESSNLDVMRPSYGQYKKTGSREILTELHL